MDYVSTKMALITSDCGKMRSGPELQELPERCPLRRDILRECTLLCCGKRLCMNIVHAGPG